MSLSNNAKTETSAPNFPNLFFTKLDSCLMLKNVYNEQWAPVTQ